MRQEEQGHHERGARLRAIGRGPSSNSCVKNCAARGDFVKFLAPSGPEGGTFEGPDGDGLAWDLVGFPAGWVQFREMDRHFWPLREGFYFPGKFREKQRVSLLGLKSSKTRNMFEFGYFGVSNKYPLRTVGGLSRLERERDILVAS